MSQLVERPLPHLLQLDPVRHKYSNPFIRKIETRFHQALAYQDLDTLENAKRCIPLKTLNERMMRKFRNIQKASKKDPTIQQVDPDDLVLIELLNWFREEFFEWVDSPDCDFCKNKTSFSHELNETQSIFCSRTEVFKCGICNKETLFPRYNDVNILLETRKGRCGEWANTFTLMCCALNYDARFVTDETDHVWTEVYSHHQKRWLHCDPCENVCDSPLMYEHGWKKKLSYIIAYSPFEIQDVTWRYTSNFKDILKRRTKCSEWDLIKAIIDIRNERLSRCSESKAQYIKRRIVLELADFLTEIQPGDENYEGRTSGALNWRIARGDISELPTKSHTFELTFQLHSKMEYSMKYSCSSDKYIYGTDLQLNQWNQATYSQENMMRKVETDWRKVYLCRKEKTEKGSIAWMFQILDSNVQISSVYIKFQCQTFENGRVGVIVVGQKNDKQIQMDYAQDFSGCELKTMSFQGCNNIRIEATLSGGVGSTAWQHAQLFREDWKEDNDFYPFEVFLTFDSFL